MDAGRPRCFVALDPDADSREALAALPVAAGARRTPRAQLHLTLAFIGEIERATAGRIAARLPALAAGAALPPLAVERLAHWPGGARARLVVAELARPAVLMERPARVRDALAALGLALERRAFRPHVTLARFAREVGRGAPASTSLTDEVDVRFASLVLYESLLLPAGAEHRPIAAVGLT